MFKAIILLKKKEDTTAEEFANWWLKQHRPLAEQLPELRKAVFNLVEDDSAAAFDGISELWFDSKECFEAAYASPIGQEVVADSINNIQSRERLFVSEHIIK